MEDSSPHLEAAKAGGARSTSTRETATLPKGAGVSEDYQPPQNHGPVERCILRAGGKGNHPKEEMVKQGTRFKFS